MNELIKNIGLGLFVNGSFDILNGIFTRQSFLITILSVGIMWICIKREREGENNGRSKSNISSNSHTFYLCSL